MATFRFPYAEDVPPLPRRVGFSYSSSHWGMQNRNIFNLLNRAQIQKRSLMDGWGGIRLVYSLTSTSLKDKS